MKLHQPALCALTVLASLTLTDARSAPEHAAQPAAADTHASLKAYPGATISLKDPKSGDLFYVESNGRRIVAFDQAGTVRSNVDVFDALPNGRLVGSPVVRDLKLVRGYLAITIAKHAYAEVELHSGKLKFLGAD